MTAHAGSLPAILLLQQRRDNPPARRPKWIRTLTRFGGLAWGSREGDPTWGHPYGRAPLGIMPPHWIILRKNSSKRYFWDNRKTKLNKIDGYYILVPGVVRGLSEATLQPSLHSILPGRSRLAILQWTIETWIRPSCVRRLLLYSWCSPLVGPSSIHKWFMWIRLISLKKAPIAQVGPTGLTSSSSSSSFLLAALHETSGTHDLWRVEGIVVIMIIILF